MKNASQYGIGVYLEPRTGRFYAQARIDGKTRCIGTYDTPQEAQKARQDAQALEGIVDRLDELDRTLSFIRLTDDHQGPARPRPRHPALDAADTGLD